MNNIIWALGIASAIWVIYDVWTKNKSLSDGMKILWTVAALLFSIITAIIYYLTHSSFAPNKH